MSNVVVNSSPGRFSNKAFQCTYSRLFIRNSSNRVSHWS